VTFPVHVALRARLTDIPVGTEVRIRYTGPQTSKAGRLFKGFEVFVSGNGDAGIIEQPSGHDATTRGASHE